MRFPLFPGGVARAPGGHWRLGVLLLLLLCLVRGSKGGIRPHAPVGKEAFVVIGSRGRGGRRVVAPLSRRARRRLDFYRRDFGDGLGLADGPEISSRSVSSPGSS